MSTKPKNPPFIVNVADCMFMIRFEAKHEIHIFTCKSEPALNWKEEVPLGSNLSYPAYLEQLGAEDSPELLQRWLGNCGRAQHR